MIDIARILWLAICVTSLCFGVFWTLEAWNQWKDDPIITTVLDTGIIEYVLYKELTNILYSNTLLTKLEVSFVYKYRTTC